MPTTEWKNRSEIRSVSSFRSFFMAVAFLAGCWPHGTCIASDDSPVIRAGSELDFRPYAYTDRNGQPTGFGVELLKAVGDKMGLRIRFVPGPWDHMWNGLVAGELDVLPVVARTPGREPLVDFSLPHTETFDAFFVRAGRTTFPDLAAAEGREIVVLRSDAAHHELVERKFAGKVIPVKSISEGLRLIAAGKHDALLCSKLVGVLELGQADVKGVQPGPPIPDYKRVFSFAVRKGDAELLEKLNQGLRIVKATGEYERIYQRWLAAEEPWRKWLPYFQWTLVGLVVLGLLVAMLQWLVRKRTHELARARDALQGLNATLEQRVADRTGELRKSEERYRLLAATAGELLRTRDPHEAVAPVCREVMDHLDCHVFFNFLADEKAGRLRLNGWAGISAEEARRIEWLEYGVAVCGRVGRDGQRIVAERIPTTPDERTELVKSYGVKAYVCHPLLGPEGKVIGTLSFGTRTRETFSNDDLSLMKAVADHVAIAMTRVRHEEALRSSLAEKDVLMRELAHRTKNNMQVIGSLLGLQAAASGDEKFVSAVMDTQDRIRAMALVHENLYQSGNVASLDIKDYVEDLMKSILRAHQVAGGIVRYHLNMDEFILSIDAALPCGLIVNELVSNSLKHAFAGGKSGHIFLSLRRVGEKIELKYRDDGPGLPRDLDPSRVRSLGLKLVYNLAVRQLRGTMEIRHDPHPEFVFSFDDMIQRKGVYGHAQESAHR